MSTPDRPLQTDRLTLLAFFVLSGLVLVGCGGGGGGGDGGTPGTTVAGTLGDSSATSGGTGILLGTVRTSSTGGIISGAQVQAGGVTSITDASGQFLLSNVPSGTLLVVANASGHSSSSKVVFLAAGQTSQVDFGLTATSSSGGTTSGTGPRIASSNPSNGTTEVDPSSQILFTFDQTVVPNTISPSNIVFARTAPTSAQDGGVPSVSLVSGTSQTYVYTPGTLQMESGASYGLFVTNRVLGTNGLFSPGSSFSWSTRSGSTGGGGGTAPDAPNILFSSPANNATDVDVQSNIIFQFEQAMDTSSVTVLNSNVLFGQVTAPAATDLGATRDLIPVPGLQNAFQYIPSASSFFPLNPGTTYSLFITNKVRSSSGVPSLGESITFTTRSNSGTPTGPAILSFNPADQASDIDVNTDILITFDRPILPNSLTLTGALSLTKTSPSVQPTAFAAAVDVQNPSLVRLTPAAPLDEQSTYRVVVSNRVTSANPVNPAIGGSATFTTQTLTGGGGGTGTIIPSLVSSNPSNGTTQVDTSARLLLTFSTPILETTFANGATIVSRRSGPGGPGGDLVLDTPPVVPVPGLTNTYEVVLAPGTSLSGATTYDVFLTNAIQASGANGGFLNNTSFSFTTRTQQGGTGDVTPPLLAGTNPPDDATNVSTRAQIFFSFNELVRISSVNTGTITLAQTSPPAAFLTVTLNPSNLNNPPQMVGGNAVDSDFVFELDGNVLSPGQTYELSFSNGILDAAGNRLVPTAIQFVTSSTQEIAIGPQLSSSNPPDGATNVPSTSRILLNFDKPVAVSTATTQTIVFSRISAPSENDSGTSIVCPLDDTGNASCSFTGLSATNFEYLPTGNVTLQTGTIQYSVTVTNGLQDTSGNPTLGDSFTFTTGGTTVLPGSGPRLIGANPGSGTITGNQPRILLAFDKAIQVPVTAGGISVRNLFVPSGDCATCLVCDITGTAEEIAANCTCPGTELDLSPPLPGNIVGVNESDLSVNPNPGFYRIVELQYGGTLISGCTGNYLISVTGAVVDVSGNPAVEDFSGFYVR